MGEYQAYDKTVRLSEKVKRLTVLKWNEQAFIDE